VPIPTYPPDGYRPRRYRFFSRLDIQADWDTVEILDARVLKKAEVRNAADVLEAGHMEIHTQDLQVEANPMKIGIVALTAEHHLHKKNLVRPSFRV